MMNEKRCSQITSAHRTVQALSQRHSHSPSLPPPRYSFIFEESEDTTVQARTSPNIHTFSLLKTNGLTKGQPWVTLRVQTRPSKTILKYPKFFEGDIVSGTIDLNITNPQVINSINVLLKGRIVDSANWNPLTFFEESHNVWEKSNGDPRSQTPIKKFDGKLSGDYQFSFSFPFPVVVDLSSTLGSKGKKSSRNSLVFQTPPTIQENTLGLNVEYQLILKITHGLLHPNSELQTLVTYTPEIIPAPPSALRQNAYLEGTLLLGPGRDPDGWFTLPSVVVSGKLQVAHSPIDVQCTLSLSLACPLSYTIGTVIPCYLTLSCQNTKALELLADHRLQYVRLARTLECLEETLKGLDQFSQGKRPKTLSDTTEAELAVWWVPPKDVVQSTYMRRLQGEIHLSSKLSPSTNFLPLCIRYAVQILPFNTKSFEYTPESSHANDSDPSEAVLQSYPVVIATVNGSGPIPSAFTEQPRRKREIYAANGDNPLGFLGHLGRQGTMTGNGVFQI